MDPTAILFKSFGVAKGAIKRKQVVPRFKGQRFQPTFIRQWRLYRGLTQERLAERVGMVASNLSHIENGNQGYTQENLEAFADALQCEVVDLLVRDPTQSESLWTLWQLAKPAEREQIVKVAKALVSRAA